MRRRYTTAKQDAELLRRRFADLQTDWKVGDPCLSHKGREQTRIARIDGPIVTLDNGEQLHITRIRSTK